MKGRQALRFKLNKEWFMKISAKLILVISAFNIIGIGLLAGVTLTLSQREIGRLADEQAQSIAREGSEQIQNWLAEYLVAARTLARIMEGYKEIPAVERRDYFNMMMRQVISASPELRSLYVNWAPNALDGMDADYANTPGTDGTGRYKSIWRFIDGEFIVNPIVLPNLDWDKVIQTPLYYEEFMLDPTPYADPVYGNVLMAIMGSPVKDKETGALIGDVGSALVLSTIQTMVEQIKPFGDGRAMLFSSGGFVVAHTDTERLGKNMRETESDTFGPFLDTMVDRVTKGSAVSFSYKHPQSDTIMQYYSIPFSIGNVPKPWTLVVEVSHKTIMAPVYRMLTISLVIGFLGIAFMSIGVFFMARSISRPINNLALILKDISRGEGDLTKTISVTAHNEIGDLAHYFNLTITKIKNLVIAIRKEALSLSQTGPDLAANMNETASSINEITMTIQNIEAQTGRQQSSVKSAGAIMGQVVDHIGAISDQIQKQSECVNDSSAGVEEMLANIQSVTKSLIQNEVNVNKLSHASEVGRTGLEEVSNDIQEIARESAGLLEINAVMENIASQTNLLSMNAAIEAAHAGDAGKGFAVVADEIRKLAESSSEQSKTISVVLKKIKDSIDKITESTAEVLLHFEDIREGVRTVTDQETRVRKAMEEQGTGSKVILESTGSLNEITGKVKQSAARMLEGSQAVIQESKVLERITEEIGNGMRELTSGAHQIDSAVNRVNDISVENKKQIEQLMIEVSRFTVD
jgi:methyl-accepting chemotaxis protein